ncbi:MAG: AAA family ATPase [Deltaproteobacteria bacterium]|nr:AAA family ATPase [Deltaproteobacteria bacterium]
MIETLRVSNYRSLGPEVELGLERLSILVGPNGSGKSNALDAIAFMRDAVVDGLPAAVTHRGGIDSVRRRSAGHPNNVSLSARLRWDGGQGEYAFELTGDRFEEYRVKTEWAVVEAEGERHEFTRVGLIWEGPEGLAPALAHEALVLTTLGGDPRFRPLFEQLSKMVIYAIFPDTLGRPQNFDKTRPMRSHGENWVSTLREMVKDEALKQELVVGLHKLTGDIEDVRVTRAADFLVAEFKQATKGAKSKRWFSARQQSDGTLRVAGILTALLQEPPLPVLGVEEPELTVHPGALPLLFDYLRQSSERSQVLITSHSPILLDCADVDRDALFVVERHAGVTEIARVADDTLAPVRSRLLSLGDLLATGALQLELPFEAESA